MFGQTHLKYHTINRPLITIRSTKGRKCVIEDCQGVSDCFRVFQLTSRFLSRIMNLIQVPVLVNEQKGMKINPRDFMLNL